MRLIDADILIRMLEHSSETWAKNIPAIRSWWPHAVRIKNNIVALIKAVPTVEAEPVVQGQWECEFGTYGKLRCSVCKKEALLETTNDALYAISNYCPNCGAKMDE